MEGTTGVSLKQGLGLTDVPRGHPGRRPGDERSYAPDCYFIIYKINPSAPGSEDPSVPGFLDPGATCFRRDLLCHGKYIPPNCLFVAPPRHLKNSFGFWGVGLLSG